MCISKAMDDSNYFWKLLFYSQKHHRELFRTTPCIGKSLEPGNKPMFLLKKVKLSLPLPIPFDVSVEIPFRRADIKKTP